MDNELVSKMSQYIVKFKEDKRAWDAFVLTSPQRSIFAQCKFLDSLNANYDLVTCYRKDKIVAGVAIIYSALGEPTDISNTMPYQGMLLSDNGSQALHSKITHEFKAVEFFIRQLSDRLNKYCLCHSWRLHDLRPFQWHNYHEPSKGQFKTDLRYTAVLDLKKFNNFESYLTSVRSVRRQEFTRASLKLKFEFTEDVKIFESLYAKTFERQNIKLKNEDSVFVSSICKHAIAGGYGKMSVAYLDDVPISAVLFLYDDRTVYYLFAANDPTYRNTGSSTFLVMHMIKYAFDCGLNEVDFQGANSPNRADFKISFNSTLRPYHISTFYG